MTTTGQQKQQQCPLCGQLKSIGEFKLAHAHPILPPEMICYSCIAEYGMIPVEENLISLGGQLSPVVTSQAGPKPLAFSILVGRNRRFVFPSRKFGQKWLSRYNLSIADADEVKPGFAIFKSDFRFGRHPKAKYSHRWEYNESLGVPICQKCGKASPIADAIAKGLYDPDLGVWNADPEVYQQYVEASTLCTEPS